MDAILAFVSGLVGKFLASLFGPKDASAVDLAASNATAQTELTQEETADANLAQASAARSDADAGSLSIVTRPGVSNADAIAALKARFPDAYR